MGLFRNKTKVQGLGLEPVIVSGSFRPKVASTYIVANTTKGVGYTVARTSAGLYTITFNEPLARVQGCLAFVRGADGSLVQVQGGDYSATARTLQIRVGKALGWIDLPITNAIELGGANAPIDAAGNGGQLASDTTPVLVANTASKELMIRWAAGNTDMIAWMGMWPSDFDDSVSAIFKARAKKTGAVNVVKLKPSVFAGVNGTDAAGVCDAVLVDATIQTHTKTLTQANQGTALTSFTVGLTSEAHANDTVEVIGAGIEYTKKINVVDLADDADNEIYFQVITEENAARTR